MPKSSHDAVLVNEIPVVQRHTLVPSLNDISDKTRKLQQHYQQQHYHHHHHHHHSSKDQKVKKSSLTALNLIDKDEKAAINYGETIMSTRKMYAPTSSSHKTSSSSSSSSSNKNDKLTSKSNHFDLSPKEKSREKMYNVISMQPSKHHRTGFEELDLLLNKAKNLQSFQTNLLSSSNKHSKTNSSNNNISTSPSSSSSSKSRSTNKTSSSSACVKTAATESRVSLNQADVITSNLARAKETIKKMSSSTNLEASSLTSNNNNTTNSNNELPVLVPLPMPFSTPSYSSFYNFGSNPNISIPQTPTPPPIQQQHQQQQYSDPLQPLAPPQLPSNIPLVIPLGPPETTSLYNMNSTYYQPTQIQSLPQPQQQQQQQPPVVVQSQPPPVSKPNLPTSSNHKQRIKELKLKKQSKQSKSMEASINKITQEDEYDFETSKNKLIDLKNLNKVESIIPDNFNKNVSESSNNQNASVTTLVESVQPLKTRLPPPPLPPMNSSKTNIASNELNIKKSDEELNKLKQQQQEISARLKQPSLHITEPIKTPELQPRESVMLITDSNYAVPQNTLYSNKTDILTTSKTNETKLKSVLSQENIINKSKETSTPIVKSNETQQVAKLSSTSKKLNDLTELLQNSTSKYGIYKGLVSSSQTPQPQLVQATSNQLQSKSAIQQPAQTTQSTKPKQMETKAVSTNDISDLKQLQSQHQSLKQQGPAEYKTSLHIGKQFNSNEITVHLVDDLLEDKKTPIKKLLIHCNRIEPISSRSVTLTPGQVNPATVDLNLNDSKNYLRKELKREIVLPTDCDIDSLESYLENGYLYFKCFLLKPPQISELKHAQIVSLPRIDFKSANLDPTSDQSTIIKRSLLNANKTTKHESINKSILKLNSEDQTESNSETTTTATTTSTTSQFIDQLTTNTTSSSKTNKMNRGRHQSLPSGSSTKSVRFNMNNRTFQLEDSLNMSTEVKNDLITGHTTSKLARHNSNTSTASAQQYRQRHRSNSNKSKSDSLQQQQLQQQSSSHRRTPSNSNATNLSTRLSNDLINDGFNCITKDGLENIFLTYFFKLPSCSPSDRTQVRIEKNSILKLKIIQEKNFAKKSSKKRHHSHHRHHHHHHHHSHRRHNSNNRRHLHDSSSSSLSSSFISSALSSSSDSSLSSSSSSFGETSDESTVNNEKITKITKDDETTKIVLREFSRRCRLPYKVFKFDETGVTVSFVNNDWVRVEIPILEILDTNLMATMTSETNLSLLNTSSKKVKSSNSKLIDNQETNANNEDKMINKLKMGGSAYKY